MADIVTSRVFTDGEKNITAAKLNDIVGSSVIQPAFVSAKPSTSTVAPTDNLLILTAAGGTYAKAPFQTVIDSVNASLNTNSAIWSARLRSFQALGNNTFEVDQRNVGNTLANAANGAAIIDRWFLSKAGTMAVSAGQQAISAGLNVPGTNFCLTRGFLRVTLTTAQASLAAGDLLRVVQFVEGPRWRELQNDVHSMQILVRSSVAGLNFGIALREPGATPAHSLVALITIPSANTWTLLTLANIGAWPAGTFVSSPGSQGYELSIVLAAGTTWTSPANLTWQNGNFLGAVGQSNFANSPVNSTFDVAYISHEPGALCSNPPMDCPFTDNYDSCLRYFQKSYDYATAVGTATAIGIPILFNIATTAQSSLTSTITFPKSLAKDPTIIGYSNATGTANTCRMGGADYTVTSYSNPGQKGFSGVVTSTTVPANTSGFMHYTSDTGW